MKIELGMSKTIHCFLNYTGKATLDIAKKLTRFSAITNVTLLVHREAEEVAVSETINTIDYTELYATETMKACTEQLSADYALFALQDAPFDIEESSLARFVQVAEMTNAGLVYADYWELKEGKRSAHPVIDYQNGAVRDDFNFGPIQLFSKTICTTWAKEETEKLTFGAYYSLRLLASRLSEIVRIPEFLSTKQELDLRKSGEKQFDYVTNTESVRLRQIEFEKVCTNHLKQIGAFIENKNRKTIDAKAENFPVKASVIIPVFNRAKTIKDAVESVLKQETTFDFNLIVVDNYSTDGTSEILNKIDDSRLLVHQPERRDLGIGGCWMEGVNHALCGCYAVQLDSDDLYANTDTLQRIVETFEESKAAMVIGSYRMTNFDLEEIPPGIIDHKEWTDENGTNNALRINGLGAPRAFYTPILREKMIPNVSYGEDYAIGLAITREYQLGRIYDPIYLCRRWEDNSDASLDINKQNTHNTYKDRIRTFELLCRIEANKQQA